MKAAEVKQKNLVTPYEVFIGAVSILSIFNLIILYVANSQTTSYVIEIMDGFFSIFFFLDFLQRIIKAKSRSGYFFHKFGWADLLASFPFPQFKLLRIFRIIKVIRLIRENRDGNVSRRLLRDRAGSTLFLVLFLILLILEIGSIAILNVESKNPVANIDSASDAIWWVYVTITTAGYGDKYPITNAGRVIGMLVMFAGVGLFGVFTGFLANFFIPKDSGREELLNKMNHLETELADIKSLLKK